MGRVVQAPEGDFGRGGLCWGGLLFRDSGRDMTRGTFVIHSVHNYTQPHTSGRMLGKKISPRSSSLGRKSRGAFANSAIWQFRSQMATELIT